MSRDVDVRLFIFAVVRRFDPEVMWVLCGRGTLMQEKKKCPLQKGLHGKCACFEGKVNLFDHHVVFIFVCVI